MQYPREMLEERRVRSRDTGFLLTLCREDLSSVYPGMFRFVVQASAEGKEPARFITNTYEYSPLMPGSAESAARQVLAIWAQDLAADPGRVFADAKKREPALHGERPADLLVLQGSPRPDGNSAILAEWAVGAAHDCNRQSRVIYPHDLDIHPCIGCYQCYNTGTCVFDDDMTEVIAAVRGARLVMVCSPVYTNTVPAGLKLVIDRMQAFHAEQVLFGGTPGRYGLIGSVAGRRGKENFVCITRVLTAFFHTLGVTPAGEVLIDSADAVQDIRTLPGKQAAVQEQVRRYLG
jgi:multimeric flavodoxin WrbA